MGKEIKMLKTINANLELIMAHLKIEKTTDTGKAEKSKPAAKKTGIKSKPAKKAAVK